MKSDLISVIIPCYNAEEFIGEAIQSVLNQTYREFELIVVDDGSTDSSKEVIARFSDKRINYIYQSNRGVSAARNVGLSHAKGNWISFLDADDTYFEDNLESKLSYLIAQPQTKLVHAYEEIFAHVSGKVLGVSSGIQGNVLLDLLEFRGTVIHSPSSVLCTKAILESVGGFNEELSTSADWELWVRLTSRTSFGLIPKPKTRYRIHSNQMHHNVSKMESDVGKSFPKLREQGYFLNDKHYRFCWANFSLILGSSFIGDTGNYRRGIKYLFISFFYNPIPILKRVGRIFK